MLSGCYSDGVTLWHRQIVSHIQCDDMRSLIKQCRIKNENFNSKKSRTNKPPNRQTAKSTKQSRNHQKQIFSNSNYSIENVPIFFFAFWHILQMGTVYNSFVLVFAKYNICLTYSGYALWVPVQKRVREQRCALLRCWIASKEEYFASEKDDIIIIITSHYNISRKNLVTITKHHTITHQLYAVSVYEIYYKRLQNVPHWMVEKLSAYVCVCLRVSFSQRFAHALCERIETWVTRF